MLMNYINSGANKAQALILIFNKLGSHQMEEHFDYNFAGTGYGGMFGCQTAYEGPKCEGLYEKIADNHKDTFKNIGDNKTRGEYKPATPPRRERACAVRLPGTIFFEVRAHDR